MWGSGQGCWIERGGSGFGSGGCAAGCRLLLAQRVPSCRRWGAVSDREPAAPQGTFGRHREGWASLLGVFREQISEGLGVGKGVPGKAHWVGHLLCGLRKKRS